MPAIAAQPAQPSVIGWRSFVGLGGGLAVLLAVAAIAVIQGERNTQSLARAEQTQALRTLTSDVLISAQNAETGQRGFLLTRDPSYLMPFDQAKAAMPIEIDRLAQGLPGDARVTTLRQVAEAKLAELQQTVDLAQAGKTDAALAVVQTNAGQQLMRVLRRTVLQLSQSLDASLVEEAGVIRRGGQYLILFDVIALLLVVALGALIAVGIHTYLASLAVARQLAEDAYTALKINTLQLDDTVRARTAALTAANAEIQRFAYIVSHDLRAPLINIVGFTGELEQATDTLTRQIAGETVPEPELQAAAEDIPEALRFIKASTSKMDGLISAILTLSREGRRSLHAELVDMRAMFEGLFDTMRHQAADTDITIGDLPSIFVDAVAVGQMFGNIVDNALKYRAPSRRLSVAVTSMVEGSSIRFDVADNGRGIAERDYERVFELFRRAGDQSVKGDGIGLAHVRALVRRMGGSIDCISTIDVGTTFIVRLPKIGAYTDLGH